MLQDLRIAIVADWLTNIGGAEKVIYEIHKIFPKAPIFTSIFNSKKAKLFKDADIRTSFMQKLPGAKDHHQWYLPLYPYAFEQFDFSDYDIVISSSHSAAKGIITKPQTLHISYCHSPMRYAWDNCHSYIREYSSKFFFKRLIPKFIHKIRIWDRVAADRVDAYIANSKHVKKRIKKYYKADSKVIYPMVDTSNFKPRTKKTDHYIAIGRLIPYKKFDLIVEAFNDLGLSLKIVGTGVSEKDLRAKAKSNIEFTGHIPELELKPLLSSAKALIFPQVEDFGIVPLEAMASGTPVIAYNKGGAKETILEGKTGILFNEQNIYSLKAAITQFEKKKWNSKTIREQAKKFDTKIFHKELKSYIAQTWEKWQKNMSL